MKKCQCSQCGSTDFDRECEEFLRCSHCSSLFRMRAPENSGGGKVIIAKGANVTFGNEGRVIIHGELIIEEGAHVAFLGKLEVVEKAPSEKVQEAKDHLELVRKSAES